MFRPSAVYEEMRTKWGFQDGNVIPEGAEESRDLLVEAINAFLPENCPTEAYAYDRPGMHNCYLILYRNKEDHSKDEEPAPKEVDSILSDLDEANYLYQVMSFEITVSPKEERQEALSGIKKDKFN